MYPSDEQIPGLDVLTTLAQNDTHVVGDTSDTTRSAKAITEANLEITIADSTNFQTELISQNSFTTALANDTNFTNTLANNATFINDLTSNATFQTNVTTFVGGGSGGGGGGMITRSIRNSYTAAFNTTDHIDTDGTAGSNAGNVVISGGTIRNLYLNVQNNTLDASTVFTLLVNGTPTSITTTIGAGINGIVSDTANSAIVVAGDKISILADTTGSSSGNIDFAFSYGFFAGASQVAEVSLSSADIQGMFATPIELVPAPGPGFALVFENITYSFTYNSIAYAGSSGGFAFSQYSSGAGLGAGISSSLIRGTSDFIRLQRDSNDTSEPLENEAIELTNSVSAFTTGNSTMKITVQYRTISL